MTLTKSNGEILKQIFGFSGYWVSNHGHVYSSVYRGKNKIINNGDDLRYVRPSVGKADKNGNNRRYDYINIYADTGTRSSIRLHRLVYQYHNPNGDCLREGFVIDHIDNDVKNNHIDNLQQITQQYNVQKYRKQYYQNHKNEK